MSSTSDINNRYLSDNPDLPSLITKLRDSVRDQLPDIYDTDFNLSRWLIGWNYDLEVATEKLAQCLEVRKLLDLNRPTQDLEVHPILLNYYPNCYLDTQAHDGSLIYIMMFSYVDTLGLTKSLTSMQFYQSRLAVVEKLQRKLMDMEVKTHKRSSVTYILDLEGMKLDSNLISGTRGQFAFLTQLMQNNYPELIKRVLIVNEGAIINALWSMVAPLAAKRTTDKVRMLGSNWKEEILKFIPAESLPKRWGGNQNWEDRVTIPSKIPVELYWKASPEFELMTLSDMVIGRASSGTLKFDLVGRKGLLKWSFFADGALNFGIYKFKPDADLKNFEKAVVVYPDFMLTAPHVPAEDTLQCSDGVFVAKFTNSSWMFTRTVRHSFDLDESS